MTARFDAEALIARMTEARPQAVALGEIVALAASVDRRLLRKARRELTGAGPEAEADLYFSELVLDRSPARFVFRPEAALALRRRLAARPAELQRAWALVSARHATLPPTVRTEELLQWHALNGDTGAVRDLLRACVSTLVEQGRQGFAAWAIDAVARMDPLVRDHEEYRMLGLGAAMRTGARQQQIAELSDERLAEWLEWLAPDTGARTELGFTLVEGGIEFGPVGDKRYSETITLPGRFPQLLDIREAGGTSHALNLRATAPTFLETASNDLVITTEDGTRLRVRPPGQRFVNAERAPRVHISYEVETYGARKSVELPFVIGVLGDFAGLAGERPPLAERRFRDIDATNFDQVMAQIGPQIVMEVPDEIAGFGMLRWNLQLGGMADFSPDGIARQVPQTSDLMLARDALNDLAIQLDGKDAAQELVTSILTDWRMVLALSLRTRVGSPNMHDDTRHVAREGFLAGRYSETLSKLKGVQRPDPWPDSDLRAELRPGDRLLQLDALIEGGDWHQAFADRNAFIQTFQGLPERNPFFASQMQKRAARIISGEGDLWHSETRWADAMQLLERSGVNAPFARFEILTGRAEDARKLGKVVEAEALTKQAIAASAAEKFFRERFSSSAQRGPGRARSIETMPGIIAETFRLRDPERSARIELAIAELSALLADQPQLNFGEPFATIAAVVEWLDALIGKQINHILADDAFRETESTWRGLEWLVGQTETGPDLKIRLFDLGRDELRDASLCDQPLSPSGRKGTLFEQIYAVPFGQARGEPFTAVLCDFAFGDGEHDLAILRQLGAIGEYARTTFIAPAAPGTLGFARWEEIANPRDLRPDRLTLSGDNAATQAFRNEAASRHIVLTMPGLFGRVRYSNRDNPVESFAFEETAPPLVINAGWALGVRIARACTEYGWPVRFHGVESGGVVSGLPAATLSQTDDGSEHISVTEVMISDRREAELSEVGLMPLVSKKNSDEAVFIGSQTLHRPGSDPDPEQSARNRLASRLPYQLVHARFAHYLMAMCRDRAVDTRQGSQLQADLDDWIHQYVTAAPELADERIRSRLPLKYAEVSVSPGDVPGYYVAQVGIVAHHQLEGMDVPVMAQLLLPGGS